MGRFNESLKYLALLFQIDRNRIGYIKSVIEYKLSAHPKKITFPIMGVKLYNVKLITRENTQDSAFLSVLYEKELTKYLLNKKPRFFVDVGSHIGRFSVLLAKNGSNVLAIEASSSNYKQLSKNVAFNKLSNIKTLNIGCSDKEEMGKLTLTQGYTGQNTFLGGESKNVEEVKLRKLDNIVDIQMNNRDIIKIDVEGFEIKVLNGMKRILKNYNPLIVVEVSSPDQRNEINNFLKIFNYRNTHILDGRNYVYEKIVKSILH